MRREGTPTGDADVPAPAGASSAGDGSAGEVLEAVEYPVASAAVAMTSGRRYEIAAGEEGDRLVVRSRKGEVVLRIEVTDAGPVLSFSGAEIELSAARRLRLAAEEIAVEAKGDASIEVGGSLRERVGGDRHARVEGDERVEAAAIELQASCGGVGVRAMQKIALDGAHIGLNDDPAPRPFGWSAIDEGPGEQDEA